MELPVALLDEITGGSNQPVPEEGTEHERRRHRRLPFGSRGTIAPLRDGAEGPPCVILLRDISLGGVGFLNAEAMKPGDLFILRFSGKQGPTIKVKCAAQRCDSGGTGGSQFAIGATFEQLLETVEAPAPTNVPATPPISESRPVTPRFSSLFKKPGMEETRNPAPVVPAPVATPVVESLPEKQNEEAKAEALPPDVVEEPKCEIEVKKPAVEAVPAESVEPKLEITPMIEAKPEIVVPPVAAPVVEIPAVVMIPPAVEAATEIAQPAIVPAGKNQEILAQVRARVLKQGQTLQSQVHQLEETTRQLAEQKAANERSAKEVESMRTELTSLRKMVQILQAKSEADDKAIAELAGLLGADAGMPAVTDQASNEEGDTAKMRARLASVG
jgi:hypothetical protein